MAPPSATTRLFTELSRNRSSSPRADDYATAGSIGSINLNNDAVIHSTAQMGDFTTQQLPRWGQQQRASSEHGTEGSEDMSIELGRGVKRGARNGHEDISSNLVFDLGDSQYEVTGTPPIRSRTNFRQHDLKRNAVLRSATDAAKTTDAMRRATSTNKQRSLSDMLANQLPDTSFMGDDYAQPTATFTTRNTRFARSRQTSAQDPAGFDGTPQRKATNNPIVQSASQTANSFMLPDLPNITELVSGTRKDGTPIFNRSAKSRSRFTSGNMKPLRPKHIPIQSIPIPDDEKAIFASLQLLKDKVAYLEMEKSESDKRAEEYEGEIIDLRSQLEVTQRRPDSALGSDEENSTQDRWRMEKIRFQASVKALQNHLDRSERKISVSDIAVKRVTKERDELVTQIGVAYFNNEELKTENEAFRESYNQLQAENEDLKEGMNSLQNKIQQLHVQLSQNEGSRSGKRETAVRSRKEGRPTKNRATNQADEISQEDLASRIAREVQMRREEAAATKGRATGHAQEVIPQSNGRPRSKSQSRRRNTEVDLRSADPKRTVSAPAESEASEVESTTELEMTQKTRNTLKRMHIPVHVGLLQREEDSRDITYLSALEPNAVANLRKKLEMELHAKSHNRNVSAAVQEQRDDTAKSLKRKSSLRDITSGFDANTGRFNFRGETIEEMTKAAKSVRVQSPHTSDASPMPQQDTENGDLSILSNTSRRRRRAASTEGMTSAFILPDITMHNAQLPSMNGKTCMQHNTASCTACNPNDKNIIIPTPVPVTEREIAGDMDITNATIRPAQPPPIALATTIKQLEDEITHLKIKLQTQHQLYHRHVPALSQHRRVSVKSQIHALTCEIERRSDQVYALYDVLEGQKQAAADALKYGRIPEEMKVDETLMSIGIDPAELAGRFGRRASTGMDGADDMSDEDTDELPWEGLSDYDSDEEPMVQTSEKRKSAAF